MEFYNVFVKIFFNILGVLKKYIYLPSKLFIFILLLLVFLHFWLPKKNSSHYFELSFSSWRWCSTHLQLTLERTVLPVCQCVFIIFRHFQFFVCVFMNKLENIASIEVFLVFLWKAMNNPIVIWVTFNILSFPYPSFPKQEISWPFVIIDWKIYYECKFRFVSACSNRIASPHLTCYSKLSSSTYDMSSLARYELL
jgi:hypothetical protein